MKRRTRSLAEVMDMFDQLPADGARMTTMEYLLTPETPRVQELRHGVVRVAESPTPRHQRIVLKLARALSDHVDSRELGEIFIAPLDVVLDAPRGLVVQPDVFFIRADRAGIVTDHVWGAPDLVIEVVSPKPRIGSLHERLAWFARYGVAECWVVDQVSRRVDVIAFDNATVAARASVAAHEPIRSGVLPHFALSLNALTAG